MTDEQEIQDLMAAETAADAPPKLPEEGVELSFPMAALTAAGENPGEDTQPEDGDAVAIQLEGKFVRAENGMGIVRVTTANGELMSAPKAENETMMDDGAALRAQAEEGGY